MKPKIRTLPNPTDAQIVARHYTIAALWADAPDGTRPRAPRATVAKAERLAWQFLEIIGPDVLALVREAYTEGGYGRHPDCGTDRPWLAAMGHDLWLTSQGHGVGFWDRNELAALQLLQRGLSLAEYLTAGARRFEHISAEFYRGWLYLHGNDPLSLEPLS